MGGQATLFRSHCQQIHSVLALPGKKTSSPALIDYFVVVGSTAIRRIFLLELVRHRTTVALLHLGGYLIEKEKERLVGRLICRKGICLRSHLKLVHDPLLFPLRHERSCNEHSLNRYHLFARGSSCTY